MIEFIGIFVECIIYLNLSKEYFSLVTFKMPVVLRDKTEHSDTWIAFLRHHTQE